MGFRCVVEVRNRDCAPTVSHRLPPNAPRSLPGDTAGFAAVPAHGALMSARARSSTACTTRLMSCVWWCCGACVTNSAWRDWPRDLKRGVIFTHEAVREWEAKLTPVLSETLRKQRCGKVGRRVLVQKRQKQLVIYSIWYYLVSLKYRCCMVKNICTRAVIPGKAVGRDPESRISKLDSRFR